jgi:hypothetical protein
MKAAMTLARETLPGITPRQRLWLDFYRALGSRNFVRAVTLARQLGIDAERIRRIERDAIRKFLVAYQNFDAAVRLCADYGISAQEFCGLTKEVLKRRELNTQRTFAMRFGQAKHLSIAEQIREFAQQELALLTENERRRHRKSQWQKLVSVFKSWFDRWSNPWQGGLPPNKLAYG